MDAFWCSSDAGLVVDPTLEGVNPHDMMNDIMKECSTLEMTLNYVDARMFIPNVKTYLKKKYIMYSPFVFGYINASINITSLCKETYIGKYKNKLDGAELTTLSKKLGLVIIQLKEVQTVYNYVWFPYTNSQEGYTPDFVSGEHDKKVLKSITDKFIPVIREKKVIPNYENTRDFLTKEIRSYVENEML